jgi:cytochrome c peroxidase
MDLSMRAIACAILCAACEPAPAPIDGGPDADAGEPIETRPVFSDAEWEILRALSPARLPSAPPDASNLYADDDEAAAFGRVLFEDPGFSGALLDADNDGSSNTLGVRGETGRVACSGCHIPRSDFSDTRSAFREISLGTGWTHRRTPSLLDVAQAPLFGWGGRHSTLHSQIFAPLENPLEMNSSRLFAARYLFDRHREAYEAIFGAGTLEALSDEARFPVLAPDRTGCRLTRDERRPRALPPDPLYECHGMPGDGAEYDAMSEDDQRLVTRVVINAGKAIAAFERTLGCGPGRFDAFVRGDETALSASEQRGLALFIGRAGCVRCHGGPFFSDQSFHNIGVAQTATREGIVNDGDRGAGADVVLAIEDPIGIASEYSDGDDGRVPSAVPPEYEGAFRTPPLRCVDERPTYMHTGLMITLDEVVRFFARGGDASGYPGTNVLEPFEIDDSEVRDLVAFLRALDAT